MEAYQKAHPCVKMKIETSDGNANGATTLQTKISLFNRSDSGWPDVVFSTQPTEMSWMTSSQYDFPLDLGAAGLGADTTAAAHSTNSAPLPPGDGRRA